MDSKTLMLDWFKKWETGDFHNLSISDSFCHTSPYGTIKGKRNYLNIVASNTDKFLGYSFKIHDILADKEISCVRYTAIRKDFKLDVTEWHFSSDGLIDKILAYYTPHESITDFKGKKTIDAS